MIPTNLARLLAAFLAVPLAGCAWTTPQEPGDLPYRTGSIERFGGGSIRQARIVDSAEIDGMQFQGWIRFREDGSVEDAELAADTQLSGHTIPEGSRVFFAEGGWMDGAWLARDTEIDGLLCNGGGKIWTKFHPDGQLRTVWLTRDTEIQGVPCEASVFRSVRFHPDGTLAGCRLSRAWREHERFDDVRFGPEGPPR